MGVHRKKVDIYSVLGERAYESIGLFKSKNNSSEIIGRKKEFSEIDNIFNNTQEKSVVHLYGEAGIGKSRLLFEIKEKYKESEFIFCQCLPEQKFSGLYPVISLLKNILSLDSFLANEQSMQLAQRYKLVGGKNEHAVIPLLCSWLNIPVPENMPVSMLPVEQNKEILFDAILTLFFANKPSKKHIVFVLEDMHWIDPTTLEFIRYAIDYQYTTYEKPIFISTSRKAFPDSTFHNKITSICLSRLNTDESNAFVSNMFDHKVVSLEVRKIINSRAEGIPLYIEEITHMLKNKNITQSLNGVVDFVDKNMVDEIPETLLESLQQKLDGLINAKETAQLASAIGRKFEYKLLVLASAKSEEEVQSDLKELLNQDVIYQQRHVSGDSYFFKHALVRDAAYQSMAKKDLIKVHLNVAQCIAHDLSTASHYTAAMVADHYSKGENYLKSIEFGRTAIYELGKISSNQQALEYANLVNDWVLKLPDEQLKTKLKLQINNIILPIKAMYQGWGVEEVKALAEDNLIMLNKIKSNHNCILDADEINAYQHKSKWIIFINNHLKSNRELAREQGETLLKEALDGNNRQNELVVRSILGQIYYFNAQFDKAKQNFKRSIDIYDNKLDQFLYIEYVIDPYLFSSGNLLLIESLMGDIELADHYCELCMNYAKITNNIANIATAYTFGCLKYFIFSDKKGLRNWANSALEKHGEKLKSSWIYDFFYMLYEWSEDDYVRSEIIVKEQIEKGQSGILSWYEPSLADTYISNGLFDKAISLMDASIKRAILSGETCILPLSYLYLAKAQYLKSSRLCNQSIEYFKTAISFAKTSGTYGLESNALVEYIQCLNKEDGITRLNEIILMTKRLALVDICRHKKVFTMLEFNTLN